MKRQWKWSVYLFRKLSKIMPGFKLCRLWVRRCVSSHSACTKILGMPEVVRTYTVTFRLFFSEQSPTPRAGGAAVLLWGTRTPAPPRTPPVTYGMSCHKLSTDHLQSSRPNKLLTACEYVVAEMGYKLPNNFILLTPTEIAKRLWLYLYFFLLKYDLL